MSDSLVRRPPLWRSIFSLFRGFDGPLVFAVLLLLGIGLLAMYSAGYDVGERFMNQVRNMLLACAIMFVLAQIPPQQLARLGPVLYAVGVALLIAVLVFGITKKGAKRWINLGVVIQPSEILKIAVPLMLAWWFQRRDGQIRPTDYVAATVLLCVPTALIMKQPDLGTALLVLFAGASIIFFAGLSWKIVIPPLVLGVVGIVLIITNEPRLCAAGVDWPILHAYQQQRVCTLLDPTRDPLGKGFHTLQGMIAIGSGGVWGKGYMQGTQSHLEFIPEHTTDFIFAAWAEEFGFVGSLVLLFVYALLILRAFWIAAHASTPFGRLLAGSIGIIFFTYAFVNLAMVSGILPIVGVPLPFVSYGGTAMVTLGLALGMLFSIARERSDGRSSAPRFVRQS